MTYPFKINLTRIEINLTQIENQSKPRIKPNLSFLPLHCSRLFPLSLCRLKHHHHAPSLSPLAYTSLSPRFLSQPERSIALFCCCRSTLHHFFFFFLKPNVQTSKSWTKRVIFLLFSRLASSFSNHLFLTPSFSFKFYI